MYHQNKNSFQQQGMLLLGKESTSSLVNESKDQTGSATFFSLLMESIKKKNEYPTQLLDAVLEQTKNWCETHQRYELALINLQIVIGVLKLENNLFSAAHKEKLVTISYRLLRIVDEKSQDYDIRNYVSNIVGELQQLKEEYSKIAELEDELPHGTSGKCRYSKKNDGNWNRDNIIDSRTTARAGIIQSIIKNYPVKAQYKFSGKVRGEANYYFFNMVIDYLIPLVRHKKPHNLEGLRTFINHLMSPPYSQNGHLISCIHRFFFVCQTINSFDINPLRKALTSQDTYQNWLAQQLELDQEPNLVKVVSTLQLINAFIQVNKSEFTLLLLSFTHAINEHMTNWYKNISAHSLSTDNSYILENFETHLKKSRIVFRESIEKAGMKVEQWQLLLAQPISSTISHITAQKESTEITLTLLNHILHNCQQLLGDAPCEIALLILGSSSHENRLPYSDLEFALLCDSYPDNDTAVLNEKEQQIVAYVYVLASLLDLSVVCFGETFNEVSNRGGFRIDTTTHFIEHLNERNESEKFIGTPEQLVANLIEKIVTKENVETKEDEPKQKNTHKGCLLIKDASFYSLLQPKLVNTAERNANKQTKHKTGEVLFARYQHAIHRFLDKPLSQTIKNKLEREFLPPSSIQSRDTSSDEKSSSSLVIANKKIKSPLSPLVTRAITPPLNHREAIALYVLLEILQKSEKASENAVAEALNGSLAEMDVKQIYNKPLTYFGLALNLLANLENCSHPVDAIIEASKASQQHSQLLTPGYALFVQKLFEWILILRIQLHLNAKAQEECISITRKDKIQSPSQDEKNIITVDEFRQSNFNVIVHGVIKPLQECIENYLQSHTRCQFPFDPQYLWFSQWEQLVKNLTEKMEEKREDHPTKELEQKKSIALLEKIINLSAFTSRSPEEHFTFFSELMTKIRLIFPIEQQIPKLAMQSLAQASLFNSFSLNHYLSFYHLLPQVWRDDYRDALKNIFALEKPCEYYNEVLEALAKYPNEQKYRDPEIFFRETQQWESIIKSQLTVIKTNQNPKKTARLQWWSWNESGEEYREERFLHTEIQEQLLDKNGNLREEWREKLPGKRLVIPIPSEAMPIAYLKILPENPAVQIQATTLEQQITGDGLQFIVAKLFLPNQSMGYPVLISKPIGLCLNRRGEKGEDIEANLDSRAFTLKVFESVLAEHEDNQAANQGARFFYTQQDRSSIRLVGIDTDHAFQDALVAVGLEEKISEINHTNIIYCLRQMKEPLDPQAINEFLMLDPYQIFHCIVKAAQSYEERMVKDENNKDDALFNRGEVLRFYQGIPYSSQDKMKTESHSKIQKVDKTLLPASFNHGQLRHMYTRFVCMQLSLQESINKKKPFKSHLEFLERFEADVAMAYGRELDQITHTPRQRYRDVQNCNLQIPNGSIDKIDNKKLIERPSERELSHVVEYSSNKLSKRTPSEFLKNFSKRDKFLRWNKDLNQIHEHYLRYGNIDHYVSSEQKYFPKDELDRILFLLDDYGNEYIVERILKNFDFEKINQLPNGKQLQESLFSKMSTHSFQLLVLKNCLWLNDELLISLLKKSGRTLRELYLEGSAGGAKFSHKIIWHIHKAAPRLERLHLKNLSSPTFVFYDKHESSLGVFSYLEVLCIQDCVNLKSLDLSLTKENINLSIRENIFPQLKKLKLDGCSNLVKFSMTDAPKLEIFSAKNCKQLREVSHSQSPIMFYIRHYLHEIMEISDPENKKHAIVEKLKEILGKNNKSLLKYFFIFVKEKENGQIINDAIDCVDFEEISVGNLDAVQSLIDLGIALPVINGDTALMHAASHGKGEVVHWLVAEQKMAVDTVNKNNGYTALYFAIEKGHLAIVQYLVKQGASLRIRTEEGNTALMVAVLSAHEEVIRWLLESIIEIGWLIEPIWGGIWEQKKQVVYMNALNQSGDTALSLAMRQDNVAIAQYLITKGATLQERTLAGTPLMEAVREGHEKTIKWLVEKQNVKIDALDTAGCTALLWAIAQGDLPIAQYLTTQKATLLEMNDKRGYTPLMYAVMKDWENIVRWLVVDKQVELEARSIYGTTALLHAIYMGRLKIAKYLVDKRASLEVRGNYGINAAIIIATIGRHKETLQWVLAEQQKINANKIDKSFLESITQGQEALAKYLVRKYSSSLEAKYKQYETMLRTISNTEQKEETAIEYLSSLMQQPDILQPVERIVKRYRLRRSSSPVLPLTQFFGKLGKEKQGALEIIEIESAALIIDLTFLEAVAENNFELAKRSFKQGALLRKEKYAEVISTLIKYHSHNDQSKAMVTWLTDLLHGGKKLNMPEIDECFFREVLINNLVEAKRMLAEGASLEMRNMKGQTALMLAVCESDNDDHLEMVKWLVPIMKAQKALTNRELNAVFLKAICRAQLAIAKYLVEKQGASLLVCQEVNGRRKTLLDIALSELFGQYMPMLEWLIDLMKKTRIIDLIDGDRLLLSNSPPRDLTVAEYLMQQGAPAKDGLMFQLKHGNTEELINFLETHNLVDFNVINFVFLEAVERSFLESAGFLAAHGASLEACNTALMLASMQKDKAKIDWVVLLMIEKMIEKGIEINADTIKLIEMKIDEIDQKEKKLALMKRDKYACVTPSIDSDVEEAMHVFVDESEKSRNLDFDKEESIQMKKAGITPLMLALRESRKSWKSMNDDVMSLVKSKQANIYEYNSFGYTVLHYAALMGKNKLVWRLLDHDFQNEKKYPTTLYRAAYSVHKIFVFNPEELIAQTKGHFSAPHQIGSSALILAAARGNFEMMLVLLSAIDNPQEFRRNVIDTFIWCSCFFNEPWKDDKVKKKLATKELYKIFKIDLIDFKHAVRSFLLHHRFLTEYKTGIDIVYETLKMVTEWYDEIIEGNFTDESKNVIKGNGMSEKNDNENKDDNDTTTQIPVVSRATQTSFRRFYHPAGFFAPYSGESDTQPGISVAGIVLGSPMD